MARLANIIFALMVTAASAEEFELRVKDVTRDLLPDGDVGVSFAVPLESPPKGRLHKVACRLDRAKWRKSDTPIDTLSFVIYEGNREPKKYLLKAPRKLARTPLNVFCEARARL